MSVGKARIMTQAFTVKQNLEFLQFKQPNYHKPSKSKYPEHHTTRSEYPKLFWDSQRHGTYKRVSR